MTRSKLLSAGLAAAAVLFSQNGAAQELIPIQIPQDANLIGLGVFSVPDYYGSDDYKAAAAPLIRYSWSDTQYVQVLGPEVRLNLVPYRTDLRAGPLIRFRQRRDDDVDDAVVKHMRPVPSATEIGVFVDYHMPLEPGRPLHKVVFSADIVGNTTGVYSGPTGNIKATYFYPFAQGLFGKPLLGTLGFGLFFASDHFNDRYFGIHGVDLPRFPERAGRAYKAEGGLTSIKIPFSLTSQVDPKWLVTVAGRYERLLGDAADSPVVKDRGDENQWIIGVAASYLF
ncbi:MipA/OmpV family protein [Massilia agilis]|uniref:MipA/OmpV family protein n=1 Tax=Massilia agilis TaxID=1811226 RepID=A0ABT2DFG1_9BURK|nr:MipA/OmpV family protein [Massilia agilis]MCS0809954.1 MipA/OmpV family protein [Massilia agilis]